MHFEEPYSSITSAHSLSSSPYRSLNTIPLPLRIEILLNRIDIDFLVLGSAVKRTFGATCLCDCYCIVPVLIK
jgi:hypothetical protein